VDDVSFVNIVVVVVSFVNVDVVDVDVVEVNVVLLIFFFVQRTAKRTN
jgi:hypothetical protein